MVLNLLQIDEEAYGTTIECIPLNGFPSDNMQLRNRQRTQHLLKMINKSVGLMICPNYEIWEHLDE